MANDIFLADVENFSNYKDKKMKISKYLLSGMAAMALLSSCSDDFVKPDPLSFYEPGATFSTESGLKAALAVSDRHLRNMISSGGNNDMEYCGEMLFSDLNQWGKTDDGSGIQDNLAYKVTPTSVPWYLNTLWSEGYNGVKYANTILSNIDKVTSLSEEVKNQYKGMAYFHRSIRYYNLVFQFGDIPLVTKLPEQPKQNYQSTKKEAIIKMLIHDLEFAVEHVPSQKDMAYYGSPNKEACRMLLAKCYLADGQYKKAEEQCDELINNSGLALMTEPFGEFIEANHETWPITRNVIWDLHRSENKIKAENKELIMGIVNKSTLKGSVVPMFWMRIWGPFWNGNMTCPDGASGTPVDRIAKNNPNYDEQNDWVRVLGRGIATLRGTYFAQHSMWVVNGKEDTQDLRHNSEVGNWVNMEDIRYTNKNSKYYNKGLMLYAPEDVYGDDGSLRIAKGQLLCSDTIRSWHDHPLYKLYYIDHTQMENLGANEFQGVRQHVDDNGNQYLFRLAETYLVRAEAKLYQNRATEAAEDLNVLRRRANCSEFYNGPVNIGEIANERGRELWYEEWRNVELTRISMCLAATGLPDEWGNTYGADWDKQSGTDRQGGSYWYQRIIHYTLYNCGYEMKSGNGLLNYTMDKRNVFWPIPHSAAIEANPLGEIKQNYGYDGYDANAPVFDNWEEAVADEDRI